MRNVLLGALFGIVLVIVFMAAYQRSTAGSHPSAPGALATRATIVPPPRQDSECVGFDPPHIDLGEHLWGTIIPFELTFVNADVEPLTVESISASCDCVLMEADSYVGVEVAPGATLDVSGTIEAGRHAGSLVRVVTVTTATSKTYSARVFLDVYGTWRLSVDTLDFGEVLLGSPQTPSTLEQAFRFLSREDKITDEPASSLPWIECFTVDREAGVTEVLVRLVVSELPPGVSTANLSFGTSSPVRPDGAVYVRVKAKPALTATPSSVFLVGEEPKSVEITHPDGSAAVLTRVASSCDAVLAEIIDGNTVLLRNSAGEPLRETVRVHIQDDAGRLVTVSIATF